MDRWCEADAATRAELLRARDTDRDRALAYAIKDRCLAAFASDPQAAPAAAQALADLALVSSDLLVSALATWAAGVASITAGAMEEAIERLDDAAAGFQLLGRPHEEASTQVSKLIGLAILGRYDEAVACGARARDTFLALGDGLAAGKIEQNLGNIAWRRDRYREAEGFHRAARERFAAAGEVELLVAAENGLAHDLASQCRIREAAAGYERALMLAGEAGLEVRQAEIECNLGNLALAQGHYARALDFLERSRRRYVALGMPHESAFAELELAEAYLDLNMAAEAAPIYARATPTFAELGMRAEQAWAMAHHGQAVAALGRHAEAGDLFAEAHRLFDEEGNAVSAALVTLFEAQLAYQRGAYREAAGAADTAAQTFAAAGNDGRALLARWLHGESLRADGQLEEARAVLLDAAAEADRRRWPQIGLRCHTALGRVALAQGEPQRAEAALERAVDMVEALRAPLPSEEFRTAFVADKLGPYDALIRICLESQPPRPADALAYAERARARALVEMLGSSVQPLVKPRDEFETQLAEQINELRLELSWLHVRRGTLLAESGGAEPTPEIDRSIQEREGAILEITRQIQQRGGAPPGAAEPFDLAALQRDLGRDTALVAYYSLDGEMLAFVVTDRGVEVARALADEALVNELVGQLRFQIEALRRGARRSLAHAGQLLRRTQHYLVRLHGLLLAPLMAQIGERRLVVAPSGVLHYLPFHALHDGQQYLIEQREVCTAPSASVLSLCLARPNGPRRRAVLVGVPDARAPRVRDEVAALARLFAEPVTLVGADAVASKLRRHAREADVLHLACHGTFRPDSPLFSALHLADGPFTVRDAYELELKADLVVLSACETGVNTVAAGDELIGLARGFFAAGAPAVLVSLWMVDDATTADLMTRFYTRLSAGVAPAQALREAQRALLREQPHPFFWAPFVLMGRW